MQPTAENIINKLPPVEGVKKLLAREQVTDDIITAILNKHNSTASHYDSICEAYWSGSARSTGIKLFNFLKDNSTYKAESTATQTVKVPAAIVADGIAGKRTDCKHYASFIIGVVKALKRKGLPIDGRFIFASDDEYKQYPTHVFAEIWDQSGKYWCDPVLKNFNQSHKYYFILKDKEMLYEISGVNDQIGLSFNPNKPFGDLGRAVKVNVDNLKKGANIAVNDLKKGAINTGRVVVTIAGVPSRNAFLLLVQLNVFNMAVRFMNGQKDRSKVEALKRKWLDLGGNWSSLVNAINEGFRRAGRKGTFIGAEPVTTTAAAGGLQATLTAAAPIIVALAGILTAFGISAKNPPNAPPTAPKVPETAQDEAAATKAILDAIIATGSGGGKVETKPDGLQVITIEKLPGSLRQFADQNVNKIPTYVTPETAKDTDYTPVLIPKPGSTQQFSDQAPPPPTSTFDFGELINNIGSWINNNPVPVTIGFGTAAIVAFSNSKIFSPKRR